MPLLIEAHRYLTEQLAGRINEMVFGADGTIATSEDGGAGRPLTIVTPTVRVIDEHTLSVEGVVPSSTELTLPIKEVCLQYRSPTDATDITPIFRYTFDPITKDTTNELKFSVLVEVK
jgi:hypothetical protein|tara:strand:+ start:94 stop:447 length:354 start_codon:yes stop_codon:yes gene_type:complete